MTDREEFIDHLTQNNCEIMSDKSAKHSVYVNTIDKSLRSAVLKQSQLSDKYIINVCKCLGISPPVLIQIRNQNQ
jgi:hypothetical protein